MEAVWGLCAPLAAPAFDPAGVLGLVPADEAGLAVERRIQGPRGGSRKGIEEPLPRSLELPSHLVEREISAQLVAHLVVGRVLLAGHAEGRLVACRNTFDFGGPEVVPEGVVGQAVRYRRAIDRGVDHQY